jgi:hypothetical protein
MSIRGAVHSGISSASGATGISWFGVMMGTLIVAFILYIAANGSLVKYKQLLF